MAANGRQEERPPSGLITGYWRKRLQRRAVLSLSALLISSLGLVLAYYTPSYHHGILRDPMVSPIHVDTSLFTINVYSECMNWSDLHKQNWFDAICRDTVDKLDGLSLEDASKMLCSYKSYMNVMSAGTVCVTINAITMASRFVRLCLLLSLITTAGVGGVLLIVLFTLKDPLSAEEDLPGGQYRIEHAKTAPFDFQLRMENLRAEYDNQQLRLGTWRVAARIGALITIIISVWAPIFFPWMGDNIHLRSMPLLNMVTHVNPTHDHATLGLGYLVLCLAVAFHGLCGLATCVLLNEDLTAPLIDQKRITSQSRKGREVRYDGENDVYIQRASINEDLHILARTVDLNDMIVQDEMIRLLNAPFPAGLVLQEPEGGV